MAPGDAMARAAGWKEKSANDDGRALTYFCDDRRHLVCHPYSLENLHLMAQRLGLKRRWFHRDHYDIPVKRRAEIENLCIRLTARDIVRICREGGQ